MAHPPRFAQIAHDTVAAENGLAFSGGLMPHTHLAVGQQALPGVYRWAAGPDPDAARDSSNASSVRLNCCPFQAALG